MHKFRKKKMIFHFYQHSEKKTADPNFGEVSNFKFFCTIDIKEMAATFQFLHNGRHWYSISIDTRKTRDPNFQGVNNLKFFCAIDIKEMLAIFQFFHNGWRWYSINTEMWIQFSKFLVGSVFPITHLRFHFNIYAGLCLKRFCVVTFLHSENLRHKFSIDSVFQTFPLVQFSRSPILGSISIFIHGYA